MVTLLPGARQLPHRLSASVAAQRALGTDPEDAADRQLRRTYDALLAAVDGN